MAAPFLADAMVLGQSDPINLFLVSAGAMAGALGLAWLVAVRAVGRLGPGRCRLGVFPLTSILRLALTPICWNHYFQWTLPAALFLTPKRRGVVVTAAVLSLLASASQTARGLGAHMPSALGLFLMTAIDVVHEAGKIGASPGSETQASEEFRELSGFPRRASPRNCSDNGLRGDTLTSI